MVYELLLTVALIIVLWVLIRELKKNYHLKRRILFLQKQNDILSRTVSKQAEEIQELKFGKPDALDAEIIEF